MNLKLACSLSVLLAAGIGVVTFVGGSPSRILVASEGTIDAPSSWVPFSARYRNTLAGQEATGRYFRDANGSTRMEITSPDGRQTSVSIQNRVRKMAWVRSPMTGDWKGVEMPNLRSQPLAYRQGPHGLSGAPEQNTIETFTVYKLFDEPSAQTRLLAPALNFFPLAIESRDGSREEYYDLKLESPDPALFEPPTGAAVELVEDVKRLDRR